MPRRHLDQLDGEVSQLVYGQAAMPLVHRLRQGIAQAGPYPDRCRLGDAEFLGHLVGSDEADAADVARETVGVLADHL
jgi:hypothetical protein